MKSVLAAGGLLGCIVIVACDSGSSAVEPTAGTGVSGGGAGANAGAAAGSSGAGRGAAGTSGRAAAGMSGAGRSGSGGTGAGSAGSAGAAGRTGSGGSGGEGGSGGTGGSSGAGGSAGAPSAGTTGEPLPKFSFFVTSLASMRELSMSSMGFGGDLRFGKATGLEGADEICRRIAEKSMPGSGSKGWRAFLSTTSGGPNGGPVHAKDRIGEGPWYDRRERLVAANKADLLQPRPRGAHEAIIDDLPNEEGIPNHMDGAPGCTNDCPDNHQVLTGTNDRGMLYSMNQASTCNDWTSSEPPGRPWCGHSWPREVSGVNWMSSAADGGCAPCVSIIEMGGVMGQCVGSAGGYGGIYCFALMP